MTTTLVLGGTRSGKSRYAQSLLDENTPVTFIAPGHRPTQDDPEWEARLEAHRQSRPAAWSTVETADITRAIIRARGPVLVDCLGGWVTRLIDDASAWDDRERALDVVRQQTEELAAVWMYSPADVVAVSNEVGMQVVPDNAAARLFQDALGHVNVTISSVSQRVQLLLAGRLVDLSSAPALPWNGA